MCVLVDAGDEFSHLNPQFSQGGDVLADPKARCRIRLARRERRNADHRAATEALRKKVKTNFFISYTSTYVSTGVQSFRK